MKSAARRLAVTAQLCSSAHRSSSESTAHRSSSNSRHAAAVALPRNGRLEINVESKMWGYSSLHGDSLSLTHHVVLNPRCCFKIVNKMSLKIDFV